MRSLIIDRNKYLKTKPGFFVDRFWLVVLVVAVVALVGVPIFANLARASKDSDDSIERPNNSEVYYNDDEKKELENDSPRIIEKSVPEKYLVTKVVDGDTIYVRGLQERIRLIGVNTPETVSSSTPIQCFGPEASDYLKRLLLGKYIGLEYDAGSGDTDKYGRLLRYVYLDGKNVNQMIIMNGYGVEASYNSDYEYRSQFLETQKYASSNDMGLWSPSTCDGIIR